MKRALPLIFLFAFTTGAVAQEGSVELHIPTRVLEVGEAADVRLICTDTGEPEAPKAVLPEGLELTLTNPTPNRQSSVNMVNNQVTRWTQYTYHLRLTAIAPGEYTVGPVTVEADGHTYQTKAVPLTVREPTQTKGRLGDRFIYAELEVAPRSVFVTESFTATLRIGIRKVQIQGRTYELELLRKVLDVRNSQLSIFADGRASSSQSWLTDSKGEQHAYEVFTVTKTIRAEETGEYRVGPIFLRAEYPTALRRGFFGSHEVSRARKETARADAIVVEVKSPVEEGRPADYTGAVGRYRMSVQAKPTRVEQGKPVTLTITISGNPIEGVAGPELAAHPELASRFDFTPGELIGDVERGHKIFRKAVFPRQSGQQTVPALSWSFFDPKLERYETLTSKPISIQVDPAPPGGADETLVDDHRSTNGTTLRVLSGGISPNYTGADLVLAHQTFLLTPGWIATLIAPPLMWLVTTLGMRRRERLKNDIGLARRQRAARTAHRALPTALGDGPEDEAWTALARVLTNYLADRFDLPPGEITPQDARVLLDQRVADDSLTVEVVGFLDACNAVRYAPGAVGELSPRKAVGKIRHWIRRIERGAR